MYLLWLDLETTGLNPALDSILEVSWGLAKMARPFELLSPLQALTVGYSEHGVARLRDTAVPFVQTMHDDNGLWLECTVSPTRRNEVEEKVLASLPTDGTIYLAGSSVHFDLSFLRVGMPRLAKRVSHRVYDVSAVRLFLESLGMPPQVKRAPAHRAKEDILASIAEALGYRDALPFL